jgi:purine-nucleoside/S-methyl-5'-thioadenosine phosphorylase / adenosine deaminase
MFDLGRFRIDGRTVTVVATDRADGDVHPRRVVAGTLERRQREITGVPWTMIDQVHGTDVVRGAPGTDWAPVVGTGDVLLARDPDHPIAVWAADCAPIVLIGSDGVVAVVHAGWRGLAAGVVDVAVEAVVSTGAGELVAVLGPCIRSCCYEFGRPQRDEVARGVGVPSTLLSATTTAGLPALDVPTAVVMAFERRGVAVAVDGTCTGCDDRFYSHRVRGDAGRHAVVATVSREAA